MTTNPLRHAAQILPHPKRGTMEIGTERIMPVWCEFRAAEGATAERPVLTIVGTDGSEDRHGSVINSNGWKTDTYMRNPVVLWQHGEVAEYPYVAKTLSMKRVGDQWQSDIELLVDLWRHMQSNLAAFLWEAYRDHGMGAMSRAFIPLKWHERKATSIPSFFAEDVEYDEVEMTEQSFVNVPSNRNALAAAVEKARSAGRFTDGLARILGYDVSPIILRNARVPGARGADPIRIVPSPIRVTRQAKRRVTPDSTPRGKVRIVDPDYTTRPVRVTR